MIKWQQLVLGIDDDGVSKMAAFGVGRLEDLAKNDRLIAEIKDELAAAEKTSRRTGKPARR
jgi:hypothetical protein